MLKPTNITTEDWTLTIKSPFPPGEPRVPLLFTMPRALCLQFPLRGAQLRTPPSRNKGVIVLDLNVIYGLDLNPQRRELFLYPTSWLHLSRVDEVTCLHFRVAVRVWEPPGLVVIAQQIVTFCREHASGRGLLFSKWYWRMSQLFAEDQFSTLLLTR